jgi:hypothetical protein
MGEVPSKSSSGSDVLIVLVWVLAGCAAALGLWWWLRRTRRSKADPASKAAPNGFAVPGLAASSRPIDDVESKTLAQEPELPSTPAPAQEPELPSPTAPVPEPRRAAVFLSYRREDSADVAGRIYDRLTQAFGADRVFKDVDSMPLGVDFRAHLHDAVGRCDVLLAVVGDQWLAPASGRPSPRLADPKDFVRIELEGALQRNIPIIPVLVRGAHFPEEDALPATLRPLAYRNLLSVRSDPDFHRDMDRLIEGVRHHIGDVRPNNASQRP